ncbi:steroid 17-alpha-hydroxylase/17,20 lyase-like isoform X2 [Anneissia japonica]|uniref:steroid 17-alpha-hydroxylase/17,20 lyase-like isoform X2 n=1 Tax=Anneissia japonica TaxID=1529436 RepID=UPI0014259F58|nr:steroid 17-alpha-hydroxylase/17,20 lyase-like isoform X2 [Anneissia japonica]
MVYQTFILGLSSWLVLLAVIIITWVYNARRPPGMPLGPFPYPIIGNMFALIGDIPSHKAFKHMSEKYGNVFSIKLGSYWAVVVNNYELVHEVLLSKPKDFSGRPLSFINDWFTDGKQYIAMAQPTPIWKYHRMLAHSAIRQFASGEYLESLSEQTRPILKKVMAKQLKGPFDPSDVIGFAVYNVIASMCFGHRSSSQRFD